MNLCKKLRTSIKEGLIPLQNQSRPMEHKENRLHFNTSTMFVPTRHSPLEDLWDLALPQWHFLGTDYVLACHLGLKSFFNVRHIYGFAVFEPTTVCLPIVNTYYYFFFWLGNH